MWSRAPHFFPACITLVMHSLFLAHRGVPIFYLSMPEHGTEPGTLRVIGGGWQTRELVHVRGSPDGDVEILVLRRVAPLHHHSDSVCPGQEGESRTKKHVEAKGLR